MTTLRKFLTLAAVTCGSTAFLVLETAGGRYY